MSELRNNDDLRTSDLVGGADRRSTVEEARDEDLARERDYDNADADNIAAGRQRSRVIIQERQQPVGDTSRSAADARAAEAERNAESFSSGPVQTRTASDLTAKSMTPGTPAASMAPSASTAGTGTRTVPGGPVNETAPGAESGPLFPQDELQEFRSRWDQVQASFVDEPRRAVEEADNLVANVVKRIAEQFADQRSKLESQWGHGDSATTEDLRQGLRRYRAFFDRLLSM